MAAQTIIVPVAANLDLHVVGLLAERPVHLVHVVPKMRWAAAGFVSAIAGSSAPRELERHDDEEQQKEVLAHDGECIGNLEVGQQHVREFRPLTESASLFALSSAGQRWLKVRTKAASSAPLHYKDVMPANCDAPYHRAVRILIIEDEPKLGDYLCKGLSESGFNVDLARTGIDGRNMALNGDYDALVLDVMLPGIDGFAVLEAVRKSKSMPVLMLTARDDVADRVRGLQSGADDYLSKPFAFSELLARIQALLRRGKLHEVTQYAISDLTLDLSTRRASRAGQRLDLTAKEFALLTLLLRRQGQVLSRTLLAEQVWDMNFDSETNVVEVAVRRLRAKIDEPFPEKLLHTVRGMGYVLESRQGTVGV